MSILFVASDCYYYDCYYCSGNSDVIVITVNKVDKPFKSLIVSSFAFGISLIIKKSKNKRTLTQNKKKKKHQSTSSKSSF